MSANDFLRLCREASVRLELPNSDALGEGEPVLIDDVEAQLVFDEPRMSAQLCCELGDPKEGAELDVYRQLLELQCVLLGHIDAMFVRDALNDRLVFTARMPLHAQLASDKFADALKTLVGQVRHWQSTVLAGQLIDYEHELEVLLSEHDPSHLQRI